MNRIKNFFCGSPCRNRFLLTQISGILTWMAFPNVNAYSWLAWICFSFWLFALQGSGWKERIVHGLMMGCWYSLPGKWSIFWQISTDHFTNYWIAILFFGLFFSSYILPFVLFNLIPSIYPDRSLHSTFFRCAALTLLIAYTPTVFPIHPGLMVHSQTIAIQTADLGGMYLVLFIVLWINSLLAELLFVRSQDRRRFIACSICLLLSVCFIVSYGMYRIHEQKQMEKMGIGHYARIAALETRFLPSEPLASLIRQSTKGGYSASELTELCAKHFPQASVIVWPELPIQVTRKKESQLHEKVSSLAVRLQKSILYSSMEAIGDSTPMIEYCTARLVLPDGTEAVHYRKTSLIPFYESTPYPHLTGETHVFYRAGEEDTVFPLDDRTVCIPSLCYDLHSPKHLRNGIRLGGNIIIHMSSFYTFNKSYVPFIDYAIAKFYAVTYRVPIVRSTNRGYGAFIQTTGVAVEGSETTPKDRDINSFPLFIPNRRSIYAKVGNAFLYFLTAYVILICVRTTMTKRQKVINVNSIHKAMGIDPSD